MSRKTTAKKPPATKPQPAKPPADPVQPEQALDAALADVQASLGTVDATAAAVEGHLHGMGGAIAKLGDEFDRKLELIDYYRDLCLELVASAVTSKHGEAMAQRIAFVLTRPPFNKPEPLDGEHKNHVAALIRAMLWTGCGITDDAHQAAVDAEPLNGFEAGLAMSVVAQYAELGDKAAIQ